MKTNRNEVNRAPFISTGSAISRRKFLRGAGIALSLPLLEGMTPVFGAVAKRVAAAATPGGKPRRFFGICNNLGLLPEHFFPKESGRDYALSPYLELLKDQRNDFTVCVKGVHRMLGRAATASGWRLAPDWSLTRPRGWRPGPRNRPVPPMASEQQRAGRSQ